MCRDRKYKREGVKVKVKLRCLQVGARGLLFYDGCIILYVRMCFSVAVREIHADLALQCQEM